MGIETEKHDTENQEARRVGENGRNEPPRPETRAQPSRARLERLYEVSTRLTRFESVDRTVPEVLDLVREALPLCTAVLVLDRADRPMHTMLWHAEDASRAQQARATAHARRAYARLVGQHPPAPRGDTVRVALPGRALPDRTSDTESDGEAEPQLEAAQLVMLPLVVAGEPIFGALQLEGAAPFDEGDLAFINTVVNQLAIAIDRHRAREARRTEAERGRAQAEALQRRFAALVDNLDHAIVWEAEGCELRLTFVSARAEELLGFSEWLGHTFFEHVHPDDRARVEALLARALDERKDRSLEHRMVARDGRVGWFHTGLHRAAGGDVVGGHGAEKRGEEVLRWQAVSVDVTAVREASGRIAEQLAMTRAITGSVGEGVLAVDRERHVTFVNPAAEAMLGLPPNAAEGRPMSELFTIARADGRPLGGEGGPLERAIQTGERLRSDAHSFTRPGAAPLPVSYTAVPLRRNGDITGGVLVFQDVLELRRNEAEQRFLADTGELLASSLEVRTTLSRLARMAVPLLGDVCLIDEVSDEELSGDGHAVRLEVAFADREKQHLAESARRFAPRADWRTPQGEALRTGRSSLFPELSVEAVAHDEEHASAMRAAGFQSMMVVPLIARGRTLGAVTFAFTDSGRRYGPRDLAFAEEIGRRAALALDNARLYEEARRATELAQRATEARQGLLAIVSHDLRNPLSAVLMGMDLLLDGTLDPDAKRTVARIQRAAERAGHLVEDLLDIGSIESGSFTVELAAQPLAPILDEAIEVSQGTATERGLRLELLRASGEVCCDKGRLLQVLGNLIGNALKFTPRGGRITVQAEPREAEMVIEVTDTGPGIPAELLPHIFDRYWQAERATRAGAGLGLAIADGLVRAHGGRIWATSTVGVGSTFCFTLPLAPRTG